MSFVGRARSSHERGDTLRAVLTLVAGLRRAPGTPDAMAFLVELVREHVDSGGIEHEIAQVLVPFRGREAALTEMVAGLHRRGHERIAARLRAEAEKLGVRYVPPPQPEPAPPQAAERPEPAEPAELPEETEHEPDDEAGEVASSPELDDEPADEDHGEFEAAVVRAPDPAADRTRAEQTAPPARRSLDDRRAERGAQRRRRTVLLVGGALLAGLVLVGGYAATAALRARALTEMDAALIEFDRLDPQAIERVEAARGARTDVEFSERVLFARALAGEAVEARLEGWQTEWGLGAAAVAAASQGDLELALALATKLERLHGRGLAAMYARALVEETRGDSAAARLAATSVLDRFASFVPAHELLIRVAARQLEFEAMRGSTQALLRLAPEHPYAALDTMPHPRDVLLSAAGSEAAVSAEAADPFMRAIAAYRRAVTASASGDLAPAIEACRQAVAADPNFVPARAVLGAVLAADGQPEQAVEQFRLAAEQAQTEELRLLLHAVAPYALVGAGRPDLGAPFTAPFPRVRADGVDDRFDAEFGDERPTQLRRPIVDTAAANPWAAEAFFARAAVLEGVGQVELAAAFLKELDARNIEPGRARASLILLAVRTGALGEVAVAEENDGLVTSIYDWAGGRYAAVVGGEPGDPTMWWRRVMLELRATAFVALGQPGIALAELDAARVGLAHAGQIRGLKLRALGRLGRANVPYSTLRDLEAEVEPRTVARLLDLGYGALGQRAFDAAESWIAAARKVDPLSREVAWLEGLLLIGRGKEDEAAAAFSRAGRDLATSPGWSTEVGMLQLVLRRPQAAAASFRNALALDPGAHHAARGLGAALVEQGAAGRAELQAALDSLGEAQPAVRAEFLLWLAVADGSRRGDEGAGANLTAAAAALGERPDVQLELARYHAAREEWDDARRLYDGVLRREPTSADAHLELARIELRGDASNTEARARLKRYLELEPHGDSAAWAQRQIQ